jgi:hypothetical protein
MAATGATVIAGVSLATDERPVNADQFDLALSADGIEIRGPGQVTRRLSWDSVSDWEIQDSRHGVVLTLRGRGAVTPLLVPRWTVDELEAALRDAMAPAPAPSPSPSPSPSKGPEQVADETAVLAETAPPRRRFARWKTVVTVTLLGVLATAVTLVLLQSAGVIHLSFLGPTA